MHMYYVVFALSSSLLFLFVYLTFGTGSRRMDTEVVLGMHYRCTN